MIRWRTIYLCYKVYTHSFEVTMKYRQGNLKLSYPHFLHIYIVLWSTHTYMVKVYSSAVLRDTKAYSLTVLCRGKVPLPSHYTVFPGLFCSLLVWVHSLSTSWHYTLSVHLGPQSQKSATTHHWEKRGWWSCIYQGKKTSVSIQGGELPESQE